MKRNSGTYGEFTISRIRKALATEPLTDRQIMMIRSALADDNLQNKHQVDIRVSIPLFFRRYYFVFFAGRDQRSSTLALEKIRIDRNLRRVLRSILVLALILQSFLMVAGAFWGLYALKKALGIDLFSSFHLTDWLPFIE